MTFEELYTLIQDRQTKMPDSSYISSLFKSGEDRIIQKVGEEAIETVIAAKNKKRVVSEVADLMFHLLILLAAQNITIEDIKKELESRQSSGSKR